MDERPFSPIEVPTKTYIIPESPDVSIPVKYRMWVYLKKRIARISITPALCWHTVGSLAAPFCPIAILTLLTKDFSSAPTSVTIWVIVAIIAPVISVATFYVAHKTRKLEALKAEVILEVMENIEADFSVPDTTPRRLKFGAYWNEDDQPLCLRCRNLLQPGSKPKTFWCSNPQCNKKHYLKTDADEIITLEEAKAMLKGDD